MIPRTVILINFILDRLKKQTWKIILKCSNFNYSFPCLTSFVVGLGLNQNPGYFNAQNFESFYPETWIGHINHEKEQFYVAYFQCNHHFWGFYRFTNFKFQNQNIFKDFSMENIHLKQNGKFHGKVILRSVKFNFV